MYKNRWERDIKMSRTYRRMSRAHCRVEDGYIAGWTEAPGLGP